MANHRTAETAALLVGSSPLPNYLAVAMLKPKRVVLLFTQNTEQVKDRLIKVLQGDDPLRQRPIDIIQQPVTDPTSASAMRAACRNRLKGTHLHYSGGTKTMAANARMIFRDLGGNDRDASYLDERRGCLRFDDGWDENLSDHDLKLDVDRVLRLHGVEWTSRTRMDGDPTEDDADVVARGVLERPGLAGELYDAFSWSDARWKQLRGTAQPIPQELRLSVPVIGGAGWSKDRVKHWCTFLAGEWLEDWVRTRIRILHPSLEVRTGVNGVRQHRAFEVDVVSVRGHRLYLASCTTDGWNGKIGYCKSKLFEATARARQMGGDLARSALVSMLHGQTELVENVTHLQQDVSDMWDSPNPTRVFGLNDVRLWQDTADEAHLNGLREWLQS